MDVGKLINFIFYKILKWLLIVILLLCFLFVAWVWLTSVDEEVSSGAAYGFHIGDDKKNVKKYLSNKYCFIDSDLCNMVSKIEFYNLDEKTPIIMRNSSGLDQDYIFHSSYQWTLYFDTYHFFDNLTLIFCGDVLCKIKRERFYFERL